MEKQNTEKNYLLIIVSHNSIIGQIKEFMGSISFQSPIVIVDLPDEISNSDNYNLSEKELIRIFLKNEIISLNKNRSEILNQKIYQLNKFEEIMIITSDKFKLDIKTNILFYKFNGKKEINRQIDSLAN